MLDWNIGCTGMYLLMIEYPKHDLHAAFGQERLSYRRDTADTFFLNLLYSGSFDMLKPYSSSPITIPFYESLIFY